MIRLNMYKINNNSSKSIHDLFLHEIFPFIKTIYDPIISLEHFVDIDSLIRNNNGRGVGFNSEKKTCRQENNIVKNSSLPGGTWL